MADTIKIRSFEVIPLRIPFEDGSAGVGLMPSKWTHLDIALLRIEAEDGAVGWGDGFAYSCRRAVCAAIEDMVMPLIVGREIEATPQAIGDLNLELQRRLHLHGRYGITIFAISAADIALHDLAAKRAGQSLAEFIGGAQRTELPAYASLVRYGDPDQVAAFAKNAADEGYADIKLHEITDQAVTAAREAVGSEIRLTTDVNCNWSLEEAHRLIPRMKELDLYWVEEPVFPPDDAQTLGELEQTYSIAIASGENACTSVEFARTVPRITFPQPSVTKVGGVFEFVRVCDLAKAHGKTVMPHAPYFGPGYWATVQIMAARPECGLLERLFITPEAVLAPDIPLPEAGRIAVPDAPGIMTPDQDVIASFRVRAPDIC